MYLDVGIKQVGNSDKMKRKHIKLAFGEEFLDYFDDLVSNPSGWLELTKEHTNFLVSNNFEKKDYSIKRFRKALQEASNVLQHTLTFQRNRQLNNVQQFKIGQNVRDLGGDVRDL
jgi:hypothetical protein